MSVINTNVKALYTQGALKVSGRESTVAMQQLSTGKRINSAKDDAAGLAIATRMTQQIRSLNQAVRNAGDAISLIQVAEGATMEITDMLQRMRELAIQAINDTNAGEQRAYLDLEFQQLKQEIVRISDTTEWNGFSILNGTVGERVGERPVYKTTAQSEFGQVMINPTTVRTVSGADAGEQQTIKFTGPATAAGLLTIGGVDVEITNGDSAAQIAAKAKLTLEATSAFSPNTNRQISADGDVLRIVFPHSEGNVAKLTTNTSGGLTGVTVTQEPAVNAQSQVDSISLSGDVAIGDKVSVAVNGEAIELTASGTDKNTFAQAIVDAFNVSGSEAHKNITASLGTGSATKTETNFQSKTYTHEFTAITAGKTVIVGGLTFTAGSNGASGSDLAAAFATGKAGTFVSGTITGTVEANLAVERVEGTNKVRFAETSAFAGTAPTTVSGTASTSVTSVSTTVTAAVPTTTFTLKGKFVAGQEVSIRLDKTPASTGSVASYKVLASDIGKTDAETQVKVAEKLAAVYNAKAVAPFTVAAASTSSNTITLTGAASGNQIMASFEATPGVINFTADKPGTSFTSTAAATKIAASGNLVAVRAAEQVNIPADEPAPNRVDAVAQVDAIKLDGAIGAGGVLSLTVGGVPIEVTANGSDTTSTLGGRLVTEFNKSINPAHNGISAALGTGAIAVVNTTVASASAAQKDTLTFTGDFVVGQKVSLTIDAQPVEITVKPEHIGTDAASTQAKVANALSEAFAASTNAAHKQMTAVASTNTLVITAKVVNSSFVTAASAEAGVVSLTADKAGTPFTAAVKTTSTISAELRHPQPNIRTVSGEAITNTSEKFSNNGKFLRSGELNIKIDKDGNVLSSFTTTDRVVMPLKAILDEAAGTITFAATGDNSKILSDALTYTFRSDNGKIVPLAGREVVLDVAVVGSIPVMGTGDLIINGVTINASYAVDDTFSPPNNAAGSAIAKAAAINRETAATGVNAVVNTNIMAGTGQSGSSAVTGRVVINGVTSPTFSTIMNNTRASRIAAAEAINRISDITGVVAVNSNSESEGIALVAKDGRNIEVSFDTADSAADFSARTGLREGVQAGTFSLETQVEGPIVITSSATGNIHNAGLTVGDYTANVSTMSTVTPDVVQGNTLPVALGTGDLVINGVPIRGATSADDKFTERAALLTISNVSTGSGIAFANAVNASSELTGVTATPNPVVALGTKTVVDSTTPDGFKSLFVNGVDVRVEFKSTHTASERVQAVVNAVNPLTGPTGVTASANLQGGVTFTTADGRNLSVWFDDTDISAAEFGLATQSGANADGVSGRSTAPTLANASTLYGGVTFHSAKAFTIEPGGNGYGPNSNFTALGLTEGTFGGVVDAASSKMTPPNTGRLSFHVGASANQIITIDLSDFGDKGTITSDITGDVDLWDSDQRVNRIDTAVAASATLEKLDAVMDKVNGTRSTMGAVMNRLEHVIDNLMNVSMNTEASRSQIEDADYAAASTELARTQIMQQAATSVLAQAIADQQNVLKLLQ